MRIPLFLSMLFLAGFALAQTPAPAAERQARMATDLFMQSCYKLRGDEKALGEWVRAKGYGRTSPDFTKAILQGPGEVWSAANDLGDFLILLTPGGNCEVWARRADAGLAAELFEMALKEGRAPDHSLEPETARELNSGGIKYRQSAYFMKQNGSQGGWLFIAITTDSDKASAQVRLSADRAK